MLANTPLTAAQPPEFISESAARKTSGFEHTRFMTALFEGWVYHWHSVPYSPLRKQGWHRQYKQGQN